MLFNRTGLRSSLVLGLLMLSVSVFAQVTTAKISGRVIAPDGNGLDAATVVAVHTPSGSQYGTTTRANGTFDLPNLRVGGPYEVTVSYIGYESKTLKDIQLRLAQDLRLELQLESSSLDLEEVEVLGQKSEVFNSDRTGTGTSVTREVITRLPTISRSASDYYRLSPAASGNSFAGRNDQYNNFSLDGSIFNNPFGLDAATPGGQTDAQPVSLDAIDQIQVSLAPYDVTQAGFTGASVNAVTKSGTNEFKGTVFGFYRNQDLTGSKVSGTDIFVPELRQAQTGFSLGGPIIRDKLFFFVNAEIERREEQGSNFLASRPGLNGQNVSRVEADDLDLVSQTLFDAFGYRTGPFENYIHNTDNEKGIFKLDWNINQNHTLTATYNFLDASRQLPANPNALGRRGPDATTLQFFNSGYEIKNKIYSGLLEVRSLFSNKFANKLQVGYTAFRDSRDPFSEPFPVLNINRDEIRYIVAGHEPFSINNRLDQDVFQITDNFNIYLPDHTITVGGALERFDFDNSFNLGVYEPFGVPYPGGTFGPGFSSVDAFVDFVEAGNMDPVVDHARSTFEAGQFALAETNVGQLAFYIQDEWDINPNFALTYGVRMDMPLYFNTSELIQENIDRNFGYDPSIVYYDIDDNPVTFDHTQLPEQTPLISPRFGFNWDIHGDRSAQLRGGSGLFTGRLPFVWIGNQVANPNAFFYNVTARDFQFPQVWRTNLGYDKAFGRGWVASTDVIFTKDVNAMIVRNFGLRQPSSTLQGVDNRPVYGPGDRNADPDNPNTPNAAYVFTNTGLGRSINVTLELKRNWSNGLYTSLGYNFNDSQDASSIEAEISSDAWERNPALGDVKVARLSQSLYGNRHRVVGSAHQRFVYGNQGQWGTTVAVFFEYVRGGRFSYTYSGDANNDGSRLNDLIYIPTDAELELMQFSGDAAAQEAQREALGAYIEQDDYLSENRGDYTEPYAALSPWYSSWDLRVLQDYNFEIAGKAQQIQFSIDLLNAGNLISSEWGVRQFPTNTQPIGVTVEGTEPTYSFDTDLENTFTDDFSLLSRWQLQFGLRYSF